MPECFYFQSAKNTVGVSEWAGQVHSLYLKGGGSETGQKSRQGSWGLQVGADLVGISLIHYFFSSGISFEACRDLEQHILNEGHLLHLCVLLNNACERWKTVARASYLHLLTKRSQRPEEDLTLFVCSVCRPWQLWGNQHRTETLWTCLQQAATGLWPVNVQMHQRFHFNEKMALWFSSHKKQPHNKTKFLLSIPAIEWCGKDSSFEIALFTTSYGNPNNNDVTQVKRVFRL